MTKSKQEINQIQQMLFYIKMACRHCTIYQDIKNLSYDQENEVVICEYYPGTLAARKDGLTYTLEINVACDSNSAMIKDVINRLDAFFG